MEVLRKDASPGRGRLGQHNTDDVVLASSSVGHVIGGPHSGCHLDAEVAQHGALFAGRQFLPPGSPEISCNHGEQRLVAIGPGPFEINGFEHGSGIAESGLVVDVIVKFQLLQRCLDLADRPSPTHSEDDVAGDPRRNLAGERSPSDQLHGRPSQEEVGHPGCNSQRDASGNPEKKESSEHRHEQKRPGHFDRIDPTGQGHQANDSNQDQPRHQEKCLGAFKSKGDSGAHGRSVWSHRLASEYHHPVPVPALLRPRLAVFVLFGVFLIPVAFSSLRGLTHVVTCTSEIARPFEVAVGTEDRPVITGSAVVEAGATEPCGGALEVDVSVAARGPNEIAVTVPITNEGTAPWRGTVRLRVGNTVIPFQIGLVPAGETRSETIVLRLPDGTTGFSGSLLIGP